jgi:hypothetical protein
MSTLHLNNPVAIDPLRRVRRLSRGMAILCLLTAVALPLGLLAYWLTMPAEELLRDARLQMAGQEIGWMQRLAALVLSAIPLGCLTWGLLQARRCFGAFADGHFFAAEAVYGLRGFAIALFVSALLRPIAGAALSVLLSWGAGPGKRALVIGVSSDVLLSLLFAGMVVVITWVMAEARGLADENAQFV